jgi:hypothetical protein
MDHTTRASWIGIIGLAVGLTLAGPVVTGTGVDTSVTVVGTSEDLEDLAWAQARLSAAGLEVPEMDIEFHDDAEPCEGNMGTMRTADDGSPVLRVCADHDKPDVRRSWRRRTLVHELAHAWEARTLEDATRRAFLELRGLTEWNDRSMPWSQRGIEHAAEIITWGIGDPQWRFDARPQSSCAEMAAGYELLTGTTAPRLSLEPSCDE